ncbi:MAG: rhodanese-like domain-containing protein [Verrucomicrobia bacterium]|nr:rhodanese-like domain-containing protein [Verrucomicrobiota bacterium]
MTSVAPVQKSDADLLPALSGATTMADLLVAYPGAQRALFARYHIGGCQSCGFQPTETLAEVCARNEDLPIDEVIAHVKASHDSDAKIQVTALELAEMLKAGEVKLLDVRTREEYEAVKLPGSEMMSESMLQQIFDTWDKAALIVVYDHSGKRSMDAAAYLLGHGFANTKSLVGGIDGYSKEVDPTIPRYRIELE